MTDYKKLVEALRCCVGANTKPTKCPDYDDFWCDGKCLDKHLIAAADAIEALQAAEPTEKQVVDYCHKRCLVVLDAALFHELKASYGKIPKRGEWIKHPEVKNIYGGVYIECPFCGEKYVVQYIADEKFCRNCGADMRAKMEVQE